MKNKMFRNSILAIVIAGGSIATGYAVQQSISNEPTQEFSLLGNKNERDDTEGIISDVSSEPDGENAAIVTLTLNTTAITADHSFTSLTINDGADDLTIGDPIAVEGSDGVYTIAVTELPAGSNIDATIVITYMNGEVPFVADHSVTIQTDEAAPVINAPVVTVGTVSPTDDGGTFTLTADFGGEASPSVNTVITDKGTLNVTTLVEGENPITVTGVAAGETATVTYTLTNSTDTTTGSVEVKANDPVAVPPTFGGATAAAIDQTSTKVTIPVTDKGTMTAVTAVEVKEGDTSLTTTDPTLSETDITFNVTGLDANSNIEDAAITITYSDSIDGESQTADGGTVDITTPAKTTATPPTINGVVDEDTITEEGFQIDITTAGASAGSTTEADAVLGAVTATATSGDVVVEDGTATVSGADPLTSVTVTLSLA